MKWCCAGFEAWYQASDERGFGIVVDRDDADDPKFLLQHRAVDRGASLPDTQGVAVSLVARIAISHCPSCGRNLRKWYRKSIDEFRNAEPIESLQGG